MSDPKYRYERLGLYVAVIGIILATILDILQIAPEEFIRSIWPGPVHADTTGAIQQKTEIEVDSPWIDHQIDLSPASFQQSGLPEELSAALTGLSGHQIESVAWQGDQWVVIYDRNQIKSCPTLSHGLRDSLQSLANRNAHIRQVQFIPWSHGWAILHDRNGLVAQGEPRGLRQDVSSAVAEIRSLAISNVGGWVLSFADEPSKTVGPFLSDAVEEALRRFRIANLVSFTPDGGYLLLGPGDAAESQGLPEGARLAIEDFLRKEKQVRIASFDSAGAWLVLAQ